MTTIVYSRGLLAADKRVTFGGTIDGDTYRKVFKTPDGWCGAFCGSAADGYAFAEWALGARDEAPPKGDYIGILISPRRVVYEYERGRALPKPRKKKFYAWGSGAVAALGALAVRAGIAPSALALDVEPGLPIAAASN